MSLKRKPQDSQNGSSPARAPKAFSGKGSGPRGGSGGSTGGGGTKFGSSRQGSKTTAKVGRVFNKQLAGSEPVPGLEVTLERGERHTAGAFGSDGGAKGAKGSKGADSAKKGKSGNKLRSAVGSQSRAAAAKVLEAVAQGKSLNEAFPMFCHDLEDRDAAFVKEIVFGTLRNRRLLMNTMQPLVDHKITEKHRIVQFLLISAMYQLVFLQSPPHAVVASTVSACGECSHKTFAPLVNAVLRRFLRENMQLKHSENLAVEHSFPDWLFKRLEKAYPEQVVQIMEQSNTKPPMILRVENSKIATQEFLERLASHEMGASLVAPELSASAVVLDVATNVNEIDGFAQGLCSVQDLSAQLAAPLLDLGDSRELRVLDCCCAPGGKTAHILDLNPHCQVTALDVDYARLQQTKSTLNRLGRKAELKVLDAQDLSSLEGEFDRILVDAPCSGTGVIRRHPDIKWLRRDKDIENLAAIQAKILDAAFAKLAVGGVLLYATCSILPEENVEQIDAFLKRHANAALKPFTVDGQERTTWQRLPGENNGDGFFYAKIVKQS